MLIDLYESLIPSPNLTEPLLDKDLYQIVSRNPLSEKKTYAELSYARNGKVDMVQVPLGFWKCSFQK